MSKCTKQIWLIRHAHAEVSTQGEADVSRSLISKGQKQAQLLGQWLAGQSLSHTVLLVSSASRSRETGAEIQKAFSQHLLEQVEPVIYEAQSADEIIALLQTVSDYYSDVFLVGHNPLLKEVFADLLDLSYIGPFHKAAVLHLDTEVSSWTEVKTAVFKEYWLPQQAARRWQFQVHLGLSEMLKRMGKHQLETLQEREKLRELGDELAVTIQEIQINEEQADSEV